MSHLNIGSIWAIGRSCSCCSEKHVGLQVIDAHRKTGGTNQALNPAEAVGIVEELIFRVHRPVGANQRQISLRN